MEVSRVLFCERCSTNLEEQRQEEGPGQYMVRTTIADQRDRSQRIRAPHPGSRLRQSFQGFRCWVTVSILSDRDYRFLGLAYDWEFENKCWVLSNLGRVTDAYRGEFVRTYDRIFALFQNEFESYSLRSEEMREHFIAQRRRIPLLHRDGDCRLISPGSERIYLVEASQLPKFGVYRVQ